MSNNDENLRSNSNGIRTGNSISYCRVVGESLGDYLSRAKLILDKLEGDAAVHIQRGWFTHKLVGGCWICDTLSFGRILLRELNVRIDEETLEATDSAMDRQVPLGDDGPTEPTGEQR